MAIRFVHQDPIRKLINDLWLHVVNRSAENPLFDPTYDMRRRLDELHVTRRTLLESVHKKIMDKSFTEADQCDITNKLYEQGAHLVMVIMNLSVKHINREMERPRM
jgi:hypothetical protein